jgi:hypothetical protein
MSKCINRKLTLHPFRAVRPASLSRRRCSAVARRRQRSIAGRSRLRKHGPDSCVLPVRGSDNNRRLQNDSMLGRTAGKRVSPLVLESSVYRLQSSVRSTMASIRSVPSLRPRMPGPLRPSFSANCPIRRQRSVLSCSNVICLAWATLLANCPWF